jgi:hypothetical protein
MRLLPRSPDRKRTYRRPSSTRQELRLQVLILHRVVGLLPGTPIRREPKLSCRQALLTRPSRQPFSERSL